MPDEDQLSLRQDGAARSG